jgi:hypothetical protein
MGAPPGRPTQGKAIFTKTLFICTGQKLNTA